MDLSINPEPRFTRAVVEAGLGRPFVLVDVGVNGGINPRWRNLGPFLEVHGFDALVEVLPPSEPGHSYYAMALGNEEGKRDIYISADTYSSSLYQQGESRYAEGDSGRRVGVREVPIHRLDDLVNDGLFTRADFIKVDTEGYEPQVLKGAGRLLNKVLAVEVETNFSRSPVLPRTHFGHVQELLTDFTLQDLAFNRIPRRSFVERGGKSTIARPATVNVLFTREPRNEDEALRLAIVCELYGMRDTAFDLVSGHPLAFNLLEEPKVSMRARLVRSASSPARWLYRRLLGQ